MTDHRTHRMLHHFRLTMWLILGVLLVGLLGHAYILITQQRTDQHSLQASQAASTAAAIHHFVMEQIHVFSIFAQEHRFELSMLAQQLQLNPDQAKESFRSLSDVLKRYLHRSIGAALFNRDRVLAAQLSFQPGKACRQDAQQVIYSLQQLQQHQSNLLRQDTCLRISEGGLIVDGSRYLPYLHQVPGFHHFDLLVGVRLPDGQGLTIALYYPEKVLHELLKAFKETPHPSYLFLREPPHALEASSESVEVGDHGLTLKQLGAEAAPHVPVKDSRWMVVVPTDQAYMAELEKPIYVQASVLGGIVLLLWFLVYQLGVRMLREREALVEELHHQATHDELSRVLRRGPFYQQAESLMRQRPEAWHGLLFVDLDRFKQINDTHGHGVGDAVLKVLASTMKNQLRDDEALIGRIGGDEFVIFLYGLSEDEADARRYLKEVAERLLKVLNSYIRVEGLSEPLPVGVSIGAMVIEPGSDQLEPWVQKVDAKLYSAKHAGRGRVSL